MEIKKNIVGIDIDCVLTELKPTMEHMADYFDMPVAGFDKITDYNLSNVYDVPEEATLEFWKKEEKYLCETAEPAIDRIKSIYDTFVDEDTTILVITSRSSKYAEVTAQWLEENNIEHDMLILTSGACKKPFIEHFKLDYMIDDKPDLFQAMVESDTTMVCVDYEYNKNVPTTLRMTRDGKLYRNNNNSNRGEI